MNLRQGFVQQVLPYILNIVFFDNMSECGLSSKSGILNKHYLIKLNK